MQAHRQKGLLAVAFATLGGISASAFAQEPAPVGPEEIIVTGTSIRGVAPVGANVITVN